MALKFVKNNEFSSPTISSPEKMPHPLATNLRTTNLPTLGTAGSTMGTPMRRGIKRDRESSEEENSSDDDSNVGRLGDNSRLAAGGLRARKSKLKRPRTGEHKWTSYHSKVPRRGSSSAEEEEEEMTTPSPLKRAGLNMEVLSLTPLLPALPLSSEYIGVNGFLKILHMNRGHSESRGNKTKFGAGNIMQRPPGTQPYQKSSPQKMVEREVDQQKEKDAVTSIYEETNRALGRLMLDRRRPRPINTEGASEDEEDSDESCDTEDE